MVDFNPAQFAVTLFKAAECPSSGLVDKEDNDGKYTTWTGGRNFNLKFHTFLSNKKNGKQTKIIDFDFNRKSYHLVDSDNDGNIDSVSIMTKTSKGVSVDYYLDKGDDGSFDVHKHSGRDGHYVEYRPKWYNPATWIKHEE